MRYSQKATVRSTPAMAAAAKTRPSSIEGRGVDGVYFPFHKSQEFIGLEALPTFIANDVMKAPDVARDKAAYRQHLRCVLG